jgi:hypothetical protein
VESGCVLASAVERGLLEKTVHGAIGQSPQQSEDFFFFFFLF